MITNAGIENDLLKKIALGFAAVTELFLFTIAGLALGYFVDTKLVKTFPWLTIFLSTMGLVLGFYRLYRIYNKDE